MKWFGGVPHCLFPCRKDSDKSLFLLAGLSDALSVSQCTSGQAATSTACSVGSGCSAPGGGEVKPVPAAAIPWELCGCRTLASEVRLCWDFGNFSEGFQVKKDLIQADICMGMFTLGCFTLWARPEIRLITAFSLIGSPRLEWPWSPL